MHSLFKKRPEKLFCHFSLVSWSHLDLDSGFGSLALLLLASNGLGAHDTTTPVAAVLLVLVRVALLDGSDELGELGLVLGADFGESEDGGGLVKLARYV
jgi:hypothetical protein